MVYLKHDIIEIHHSGWESSIYIGILRCGHFCCRIVNLLWPVVVLLQKKAAKKGSDDGDSDMGGADGDMAAFSRRATTGRAKAPVKYNFDDSEEDFDDY